MKNAAALLQQRPKNFIPSLSVERDSKIKAKRPPLMIE
jgi:hypothetical protein